MMKLSPMKAVKVEGLCAMVMVRPRAPPILTLILELDVVL